MNLNKTFYDRINIEYGVAFLFQVKFVNSLMFVYVEIVSESKN